MRCREEETFDSRLDQSRPRAQPHAHGQTQGPDNPSKTQPKSLGYENVQANSLQVIERAARNLGQRPLRSSGCDWH